MLEGLPKSQGLGYRGWSCREPSTFVSGPEDDSWVIKQEMLTEKPFGPTTLVQPVLKPSWKALDRGTVPRSCWTGVAGRPVAWISLGRRRVQLRMFGALAVVVAAAVAVVLGVVPVALDSETPKASLRVSVAFGPGGYARFLVRPQRAASPVGAGWGGSGSVIMV